MKLNIQKRILSLFFAFVLCFTFLVLPVRADSFFDSNFINVLDMTAANNSGQNLFSFTGSVSVTYDLGNNQLYNYVDIVIYSTTGINSASLSNPAGNVFNLTVLQIDSLHYRLYGKLNNYGFRQFILTLNSVNTTAVTYAQVLSFHVTSAAVTVNNVPVSGLAHTGLSGTIKTEFDNNTIGVLYAEAPDYSCEITLVPLEWKEYDYLTIYLKHDAYQIVSISADLNKLVIPYQVDYLDSSVTPNEFRYAITLDLRSLDRTSSLYPNVRIQCRLSPNDESIFQILNATGYIFSDAPSSLLIWFRRILANLENGFSALGNTFTSGLSALGDRIHSSLGSVFNSHFNWLTGDMALWAQRIIDAINGNENTSGFGDDVENAKDELENIGSAINGFTRPDVDEVLPTIDITYDNGTTSILTGLLTDPTIGTITTGSLAIWLICLILGI